MIEPANILLVAPRKDNDPLIYTYEWFQKAKQMALDLGYNVKTLEKDEVTYKNLTNLIQTFKPRLFAQFSHGCPNSLQGQHECVLTRKFSPEELLNMYDNPDKHDTFVKMFKPLGNLSCPGICKLDDNICNPLCSNNTNIHELKGSIIFATACFTAKQLGLCSIKHGIQSYIGFQDLLMFPVDTKNSQDMFGEIQLKFYESLLLGKSVSEAEQDMSTLEDMYITKFKDTKWVALPMVWNKVNRRILGDKNASIYQ